MHIIKIGDEYVNLDNVTFVKIKGYDVWVKYGETQAYIKVRRPRELQKLLDKLSELTEAEINNAQIQDLNKEE